MTVKAMNSPRAAASFSWPMTVLDTQNATVTMALENVVRKKRFSRPMRSATKPTAILPIALQALLTAVRLAP
jgi:hypothetical protein